MLSNLKDLLDFKIQAIDGALGHVENFYFDDNAWVIRYCVVDTGSWLSSRKVLISPIALGQPDWAEKALSVLISKQAVEDSPSIDTAKPVSRQHEISVLGYFGYPHYWGGLGLWGAGLFPGEMMPGYDGTNTPAKVEREQLVAAYAKADAAMLRDEDIHLRSYKEILNYHIMASDGDIGHVEGMIIEVETWAIRYLVVNTNNWWEGNYVLVAPQWIDNVSWHSATVQVNLTRLQIKEAPSFNPNQVPDRKEEIGIYAHYGQAPYWDSWAAPADVIG